MMKSEIAALDTKITYWKKEQVQQANGSYKVNYIQLQSVNASIRYKTGRELIKNTIIEENTIVIRVYNDQISQKITPNNLISFDLYGEEKVLQIIAKNYELASKKWIDFTCKDGVVDFENGNG